MYAMAADDSDNPHPADPSEPDKPSLSPDRPQRGQRHVQSPQQQTPQATKIEVTGKRATDLDIRHQSTASKLVFSRDELDQYGDSTVGEMLKRLPGVTVGGKPGRGGDIRMRGLGSGYTQILVNGERPPRGFSLDSLEPEQIERIEVIRAPVAEFSAQAIAGTINIVLREELPHNQTELRVAMGEEQGYLAPNVSFTQGMQFDKLSVLFSGSAFQNDQNNQAHTDKLDYDASNNLVQAQHLEDDNRSKGHGVHLAPRIVYRDGDDSITFQPFMTSSQHHARGTGVLEQDGGIISPITGEPSPPPYTSNLTQVDSDSTVARGFGNWQRKYPNGGKLEIKFGLGASHSDSNSTTLQLGGPKGPETLTDDSTVHDSSANVGGKLEMPLDSGYKLGAGWEVEFGKRTQTLVSLDNGQSESDDPEGNLTALTERFAAYAQDEWDINPHWAAYTGLRWEGIRTRSQTVLGWQQNSSSVLSPSLHGVWRLPGSEKDQVRASITRSYRAPGASSLLAILTKSHNNQQTSPDSIGNPNLKPELAWGFELGYEHYLTRNGLLAANLFTRSIDNLIRRQTSLGEDGRWVSSPLNIGHANAEGIELEAKFQLAEFFEHAPAIELRSNYSRFWSSVDGIPGPNNRLDQQPKQTANLGLDYKLMSVPLTLGGNLNWTPAYVIQTSGTQTSSTGNKRVVDMYGLWKFSPKVQLRVAVSNLLRQDYLTGSGLDNRQPDGSGVDEISNVVAKTYATWTVKLEMKF